MTAKVIINSPLGKLALTFLEDKLTNLTLLPGHTPLKASQNPVSKQAVDELAQYFADPTHQFTVPLQLKGTPFQQRVWHALCKIPSCQTLTYGQLAKQLKTSPRAIGQACRRNPIPVIVPCHRIVAIDHLGGYAGTKKGKLMDIKKWLLQHEQKNV